MHGVVCGWQVPPQTMGRDMQTLLDSAVGSDVTFLVEDERMQAHRIILQAAPFPPPPIQWAQWTGLGTSGVF